MEYQNILFEVTDHVATITLNRPESMNAINYKTRDELHAACGQVSADSDVWVCIITGAGERAFCTGLDLKERAREVDDSTFFEKRRVRNRSSMHGQNLPVATMEKPTIAAIRGYAVGGGLELALACDIRVAAEDAKLGMFEVRRGRLGGGGGTQRLPRLIGMAKALELSLTGEAVGAEEALRLGAREQGGARGQLHGRGAGDRGQDLPRRAVVGHRHQGGHHQGDPASAGAGPEARERPGPGALHHRGPEGRLPRLRREAPGGVEGPIGNRTQEET